MIGNRGAYLKSGNYQVDIKKKWTWTIPFKVEGESAKKEDNQLHIKDSNDKRATVYIVGIQLVVGFIVPGWILYKIKRRKK
ncbi:hypothetical protein [Enterococcus sp. AZ126]|uniref:hypothetical protein n=1 Tax=Enterococcus sp. AZ126 TaxID=2774635 RepID=UPI003F20DA70